MIDIDSREEASNNYKTIRVVTICNKDHLDVWRLTSALLPKMLIASDYSVYVPNDEVELFKKHTNERVKVLSQDMLDREYKAKLAEKLAESGNDSRLGWYLQQFYKLELVFQKVPGEQITIIWDADCVPTRNIKYEDDDGKLLYMKTAFESHVPYFDLIQRLLGLNKIVDMSFVIPCFPILGFMAEELRERIEEIHNGLHWSDVLIREIDFRMRSGFSETELLGTWVSNVYPSRLSIFLGTWERRGQKRFGYARNLSERKLLRLGTKHNLDIISFENWDTRGYRLICKRVGELLTNRRLSA
jgi:hypothetical protein